MSEVAAQNWAASRLAELGVPVEEWTSDASTHSLRYATHGLFRYFGKFPPTVPRHLLDQFTDPGDTVIDPMVGSGTTAVECLLSGRGCMARDVSPLSAMLTRVKTRRIDPASARKALAQVLDAVDNSRQKPKPELWPASIKTAHFFLPETAHWLHLLRSEIARVKAVAIRELLQVALASIIRRVSKATSQQGRPFLDVESAEPDPRPRFQAAAELAIERTSALPDPAKPIEVAVGAAAQAHFDIPPVPLIICHPPYFNGYRYSAIFSFELAWLGHPVKAIAAQEVKEFFKVGKPGNVGKYVDGMADSLRTVLKWLRKDGTLALMIGDTNLRGERIPTTRLLLDGIADVLRPIKVAVRTPQFTEASWVASQRRTGAKVGIRILDYVVLLGKVR